MTELTFSNKTVNSTFDRSIADSNYTLKKPMLCPLCNAYQDSSKVSSQLYPSQDHIQFGSVCYKCSHCKNQYLVIYEINHEKKIADFGAYYPQVSIKYENETIAAVSPRFIDMYNQALTSESLGNIELAAVGFRQALECLVKDFAIIELKRDRDEVIGKTLYSAIGDYFEETSFVSSADVVRILGNDYAHYDRKYPQLDFEILKRYMLIFINLVETKRLISHPPVQR